MQSDEADEQDEVILTTFLQRLRLQYQRFRVTDLSASVQLECRICLLRISLTLPVEIQNYILETFWNHADIECSSPETIRACALTCKTWHKIARRHVFRVVILRSWEALQRLKTQMFSDEKVIGCVQRVRLCGPLPPFDKASSGKALPAEWAIQDRWLYLFPYDLSERIRDKTSESHQPFNVRIFELFDFGHLSGAVEDCKWFGFWIQHLLWLKNVEILYLSSCEMSANAMDALALCFPRLRRVGLTNVDLTANNYASLRRIGSSSLLGEEETLRLFAEMCAHNGIDFEEFLRAWIPQNGVEYVSYADFDLELLFGWFNPDQARDSLRILNLSPGVDHLSLADFIDYVGPSPVLEYLWMSMGYSVASLRMCDFDVSKLTNLKSIGLYGGLLDPSQCDTLIHILSTLNAPRLQRITLAFHHDKRCMNVKELDDCLAERFKNLHFLTVECDDLKEEDLECIRQEIQEMFPQMAHRGMLRVQIHKNPFCY